MLATRPSPSRLRQRLLRKGIDFIWSLRPLGRRICRVGRLGILDSIRALMRSAACPLCLSRPWGLTQPSGSPLSTRSTICVLSCPHKTLPPLELFVQDPEYVQLNHSNLHFNRIILHLVTCSPINGTQPQPTQTSVRPHTRPPAECEYNTQSAGIITGCVVGYFIPSSI